MKILQPQPGIRLPSFDKDGFSLGDGEARHREFPDTFHVPDLSLRENLRQGDFAKLMFEIDVDGEIEVERMWAIVRERTETGYVGVLDNDAFEARGNPHLLSGAEVGFEPRHVIDVTSASAHSKAVAVAPVRTPWTD